MKRNTLFTILLAAGMLAVERDATAQKMPPVPEVTAQNVTGANGRFRKALVSWKFPTPFRHDGIEVWGEENGSSRTLFATAPPSDSTALLTELLPGTEYRFSVRTWGITRNRKSYRPFSKPATVVTEPANPGGPMHLITVPFSYRSVALLWMETPPYTATQCRLWLNDGKTWMTRPVTRTPIGDGHVVIGLVEDLACGTTYRAWLQTEAHVGATTYPSYSASDTVLVRTLPCPEIRSASAEMSENAPSELKLLPNYPNPFNAETTIVVEIPRTVEVMLEVWNTLGERVATLADGLYPAGTHRFSFDGLHLPTGAYFCRLRTPEINRTMRMLLVR